MFEFIKYSPHYKVLPNSILYEIDIIAPYSIHLFRCANEREKLKA